jgi:hypothetical protein
VGSHNVFFGMDAGALPLVSEGRTETTYAPAGPLDLSSTYFWRIDEVNAIGVTEGFEWSFTTRSIAGPASMHVDSIVLDTAKPKPPMSIGRATVIVVDDLGDPVARATVDGMFSGDFNESAAGDTDGRGSAVLATTATAKRPSFSFRVTGITDTYTGLTYEPDFDTVIYPSYP